MLDRTIDPPFGKIDTIELAEPTVYHLDNGIPVFCINAGTQEVLKIDLVFKAGTSTPDKKLVASTASKLLTEGTKKRSAQEIAESVDFYGSYLQTELSHDHSAISLYTLNKHLDKTVDTMAEVYQEPTFLANELETFLMKSKQEMMVSEEKVGYLGSKAFSAALFGTDHPYGRSANMEDYDKIGREELINFHNNFIKNRIDYVMISGKLEKNTIPNLNKRFGQESREAITETQINITALPRSIQHIEKADSVQNVIKIGRVLFNRNHTDFIGMQVLTTVLGGYFGSRLMANIREDKGYTYGIGAGMVSMKYSGYLSISTEVGSDVCAAALTEIYLEIEHLRNELIPTKELELVKNYMLGSILKSIDGPFEIASKWKGYMKYGLGIEAHYDLIRQIKTITSERLLELANTYLQRKDLIQITAGAPLSD